MGKYCLILFDSDGYTFITETKRLASSSGRREKSSRLSLSYEGKLHTVEILELSDDLKVLEAYDDTWIESLRGKAVTEERDRREASRSRRRLGGYLDIWPKEQDEPNEPLVQQVNQQTETVLETETAQQTESTQHQSHENQFTPFDLESNGRRVNIQFQGLGESSRQRVRPVRQPQFQGDLTVDEMDLVNEVVRQHISGKSTIQTQTEDVVVLGTEEEVRNLLIKDTSTNSTQTSLPSQSSKDSQTDEAQGMKTGSTQTSPLPSQSSKDIQTDEARGMKTGSTQTFPLPSQSSKDIQTDEARGMKTGSTQTSPLYSQSSKDSQTDEVRSTKTGSTQTSLPSQSSKDSQTDEARSTKTGSTQTSPLSSQSSKDSQTDEAQGTKTASTQTSPLSSQSSKDSQTDEAQGTKTESTQTYLLPSQSSKDSQTDVVPATTKFCQTEDRPSSPENIVLILDGPHYKDRCVQTSRQKLTRSQIFIESIEPSENRDLARILEGQQKMEEKLDQLMKSGTESALPVLSTPFIRSVIGEKENETPVQGEHLITRKVLADITELGNRRELFPEDISPAPTLPLKTPPTVPFSISAQSTPSLSPPVQSSPANSLSPVAALSPLKPQSPMPEPQSPTPESLSRPSSPTFEPPAKRQHIEHSTHLPKTKPDVLEVECPINARVVHVSSAEDICPGNVEFFVRKDIADRHFSESCSSGNFLWRMTKILYKDEELIDTNYTGKKGKQEMSPRRKHTLKHIYSTYIDNSKSNFQRAISAVNNGILRMNKK